jgi:hypothetical protein
MDPLSTPSGHAHGRRDVLLVALVLLALVLRAPRLLESLWYDEISAWLQFGAQGPAVILSRYFDPANHVAHTLASWCAVTLLEPVLGLELALRLPALLASLLLLPAMHALARPAFGARVALLAALVAAAAPVAVLEGVEARGYSMMMTLAAAATALLDAALRSGGWRWAAYALALTLGVWTHPVTALAGAGHALWIVASWRRLGRRGIAGFGALAGAAALSALLYAPLLREMMGLRSGLAATTADQPRLLGAEGVHLVWQMGGAWAWWAALPGLAVVTLGAARGLATPARRRVALLAGLGLVPYVALVLAAGTWSYARFALFAWPAAALLLAAGLDAAWRRRRGAGLAVLAILLAGWATDLITRPPKQPLRDAAEYIAAQGGARPRVLAVGLAHGVFSVYAARMDLTVSLGHGSDIDDKLAESRPRWVVVYYPRSVPQRTYAALRAAGFTEAVRFEGWVDWGNGDVVVWSPSIPQE